MYAIRFSRFIKNGFSKKPDGLFLRRDGGQTDHKANARVFAEVEEAVGAALTVARPWQVGSGKKIESPVFVVEVSVKPVIHQQTSVVCEF